jgi:carboxylesterase
LIRGREHTLRHGRVLGGTDLEAVAIEGRSPCLLAFHGFTGTASELRPLIEAVAAQGYAMRVPLLPGHGTSPDALQSIGFAAWCAAMRLELELAARDHEGVVLCGFSLGSLVAMQLASEGHPKVRALVVLGNALTLTAISSVPLALFERFGVEVPDWYLVKPRAADMTDRVAARKITTYDRHPIRAAMEVFRAGKAVKTRVSSIHCPTLILHGARDHVCSVKNAGWLAANIGATDVTVKIFPKSAHVIAADVERDAVASEVLAFLARF